MKPASIVVLVLACLAVAGCNSEKAVSGEIVARVNAKEITAADLDKLYNTRIAGAPTVPTAEEAQALKFQLLGDMINDEILLQLAADGGLTATEAEVDTKFTDLKSQFSEEQFQESLKVQKMTVEDVRAEMKKGLTLEKLIAKEITARISVSAAEIQDFYEKNKAGFNFPEGYRLQHILVTPFAQPVNNAKGDDARSPAAAKTKAERLHRDVQGGLDFAVVARDWSEDTDSAPNGGDWGYRSMSDLEGVHPRLSETVRRLRVGESSSLIETNFGYHILKLVDRDSGGQKDPSNPQIEAQIRQEITNRKNGVLRAAFSEIARNRVQVTNYMAERLLETVGKAVAASAATAPSGSAESKPSESKSPETAPAAKPEEKAPAASGDAK